MSELAESSSSDDDKGRRAKNWKKVERQEDNELNNLDDAPWSVDGSSSGLSEHSDRVRCV
jgi:hypothetical protein